jgi:glycosyltransferase involved in cell wall biosynthesis
MVDDRGDFCRSSEGGKKCAEVCKTYGCKDFKERLRVAKKLLSKAALVTVPSEFVAKILSSEFPSVEFLPIAHGISRTFKPQRKRECVRRFVYAGTVTQLKGIHLLIEAFSRLEGEDLSLLIYGSGDSKYESRLRSMADSRVKFMGAAPIEDMPKVYNEADCVIIPSMWYETYNFVLREAASCGALVIAADIGAMSEAVRVGKNGFLFSPASCEDLYEKMRLATEFDFKSYEYASYPTIEDEGEIYSAIYSKVSNFNLN